MRLPTALSGPALSSSANGTASLFSWTPASITPRAVIVSIVVLGFAFVLNRLIGLGIQRALERHAHHGGIPAETRTRMLIIRRIVTVAIWLFAIGVALGQFNELKSLSTSLLAAGGVSGIIVGFAAQNMLGNAVAGVLIAFSQPIRIGDDVEFRTERGTIIDMTLFFTVIRLVDGKRLIVPNNTLSNEVLKNLTMGDVTRVCRAEVLIPRAFAASVREKLLEVSKGFAGTDASVDAPEVFWVRLDERGVLLRMQVACIDGPAAILLGQLAYAAVAAMPIPREIPATVAT